MSREHKVSTFYHRSGITLIPFILSLIIMLVVVYPGQSESSEKQFTNTSQRTVSESNKGEGPTKITKKSIYQKTIANVKRLFSSPKQSQSEESQSRKSYVTAQSDLIGTKTSEGETGISPNKDNIYDILIAVVKHQKAIESMNKGLIEKLSQKNDTITSLKYTEEVLWTQLEESEDKYWNTVTDKAYMEDVLLAQLEESEDKYWNTITDKAYMEDVLLAQLEESENKFWASLTDNNTGYQKTKILTDLLDLKDYVIKELEDKERILRAQLENNNKKFQEALAARDAQYQKAVKSVSSSIEPVFGYSPPATEK